MCTFRRDSRWWFTRPFLLLPCFCWGCIYLSLGFLCIAVVSYTLPASHRGQTTVPGWRKVSLQLPQGWPAVKNPHKNACVCWPTWMVDFYGKFKVQKYTIHGSYDLRFFTETASKVRHLMKKIMQHLCYETLRKSGYEYSLQLVGQISSMNRITTQSSRNTLNCSIYKPSRETGLFLWELPGQMSSFKNMKMDYPPEV